MRAIPVAEACPLAAGISAARQARASVEGRDADWDLAYEELSVPVLVVTGLQDHVFLEPEIVDRLAERLPTARRLDLPEAGHLIPAEQPERMADLLLSFAEEMD